MNRRHRAFTLMELIVSVVVLTVLSTLAIPTFVNDVTRAHLAAASEAARAVGHDALSLAVTNQDVVGNNPAFSADMVKAASEAGVTSPAWDQVLVNGQLVTLTFRGLTALS